MKIFLVNLFLLLSICLSAQETSYKLGDAERKEFLQMKSLKSAGAENNNNIIYQRLQLNVNPNFYYISGEVTSYFIPSSTISYIEFDLDDTLTVDSILYHQSQVQFTHTGDIIHIILPVNVAEGTIDSVSVF